MDKSSLIGFPFFMSFAPSGNDGCGLPVVNLSCLASALAFLDDLALGDPKEISPKFRVISNDELSPCASLFTGV
jgi:hypothetical protein